MSTAYISAALRVEVRQRARHVCEYCLLHEEDVMHGFHVDHVISEKHAGPTEGHNLAFCCPFCNRAKGSDVAGYIEGRLVRLFNPRIDHWSEHFALKEEHLIAVTDVAAVTIQLLGLNDPHRLALRRELMAGRLFPSSEARETMNL